jgi:catechol 2,3-dioxygenase-like lactoylglutathione lyase family enzyme
MSSEVRYDGGLTCALNVTDLERSIRWYQDILGFKLLYRVEELGWCELATETPRVNVGLSQVEMVETGGGATLTFGVVDIDASRRLLEAKDVRFDGPTRTYEGMVRLATFYDPDQNALMLYQNLQRS